LVGSAGGSNISPEAPKDLACREPWSRKVPEESAMACPGVARKTVKVLHNSCPKWIEVEIAHKLQEVDFLVDHDGLVAVLKEVPCSPVAAVELARVTGQERSHAATEGTRPGLYQEVGVVWKDREGIHSEVTGFRQRSNSPNEIVPVLVIAKDDFAIQPPDHYVV
jgi:hypothetical protein